VLEGSGSSFLVSSLGPEGGIFGGFLLGRRALPFLEMVVEVDVGEWFFVVGLEFELRLAEGAFALVLGRRELTVLEVLGRTRHLPIFY
jgi:hypothetical protein